MSKKKRQLTTRRKTKIIGTQQYVNPDTGEVEDFQVISVEERDANFHKLWLGHIISTLDLIGNQKIKVLSFILENLNSENMLLMTLREIADKTEISYKTVADTFKALQESNFLKKVRSGTYQVNPDVIFKGGKNNRLNVLIKYQSIGSESNEGK
ncbi:replication/maintenance protein RepL [Bacillus smithii]|jgi:DNA-binding HxlR family transcriptional regulator|uniref:replication/maintenance protein RepL n=1 Tax=Bacillus smithii TaxID=1479 RepID=UPI002E243281|nr:replication/maintenance protein RepL [Bacillus smithii]